MANQLNDDRQLEGFGMSDLVDIIIFTYRRGYGDGEQETKAKLDTMIQAKVEEVAGNFAKALGVGEDEDELVQLDDEGAEEAIEDGANSGLFRSGVHSEALHNKYAMTRLSSDDIDREIEKSNDQSLVRMRHELKLRGYEPVTLTIYSDGSVTLEYQEMASQIRNTLQADELDFLVDEIASWSFVAPTSFHAGAGSWGKR